MARAHHAFHLQHVLVAQAGRHGKHGRVVDFHRHLHDAFMIAQIDEAHAALVAGNVGPAGEGNGLANQGLIDQAAEVGTHGGKAPQEDAGTRLRRTALYSAA
ncbi:hypothetical protein D3C71_820640 [compost metagenome]